MNHSVRPALKRRSFPTPPITTTRPPIAGNSASLTSSPPSVRTSAEPAPRILALALLVLGLTLGGTLYVLRPHSYDPTETLSAASAATTPAPASREMVKFLETASPKMRRQLGLATAEPAPLAAVPSPVHDFTVGYRYAEALNDYFTRDPSRPDAHQQGQRVLEEAGEAGLEEMARLYQSLPFEQIEERRLALEFLQERALGDRSLAPKVRQFLAHLSTLASPGAPQAYWQYTQLGPSLAERRQVLAAAVAAQTDPHTRQTFEELLAAESDDRTPAQTLPQE